MKRNKIIWMARNSNILEILARISRTIKRFSVKIECLKDTNLKTFHWISLLKDPILIITTISMFQMRKNLMAARRLRMINITKYSSLINLRIKKTNDITIFKEVEVIRYHRLWASLISCFQTNTDKALKGDLIYQKWVQYQIIIITIMVRIINNRCFIIITMKTLGMCDSNKSAKCISKRGKNLRKH